MLNPIHALPHVPLHVVHKCEEDEGCPALAVWCEGQRLRQEEIVREAAVSLCLSLELDVVHQPGTGTTLSRTVLWLL